MYFIICEISRILQMQLQCNNCLCNIWHQLVVQENQAEVTDDQCCCLIKQDTQILNKEKNEKP